MTTPQLEQTVREKTKQKEKLMKNLDKELEPFREELEARKAQKNISTYQGLSIALLLLVVILAYLIMRPKPGSAIE